MWKIVEKRVTFNDNLEVDFKPDYLYLIEWGRHMKFEWYRNFGWLEIRNYYDDSHFWVVAKR